MQCSCKEDWGSREPSCSDFENCDSAERIASLEYALAESVKLQSHYAELLNQYDGGKRMIFSDAAAWQERLRGLAAKSA
jgi:hypothetical protein